MGFSKNILTEKFLVPPLPPEPEDLVGNLRKRTTTVTMARIWYPAKIIPIN